MRRNFNIMRKKYLYIFLTALILAGCASIGNPNGGFYDEEPPVLVKSNPSDGETNVKEQKLKLRFNENIKLDNLNDKIVISPPQQKAPVILSNAKTLTVELGDSLLPNTTYSLDFSDGIQDNNEGNVLEGLAMTFSTGEVIDSMKIAGVVLNAKDLEPVTGAYVGIYPDSMYQADPDSVFIKKPFTRAGKTDSNGRFSINGVAKGAYRIYAIMDGNTNYRYDMTSEDIAFLDSLIVPTMAPATIYDTVWNRIDSAAIDTIIARDAILYSPGDVRLRLFNEGKVTRYLEDFSWKDSLKLKLTFAANMPQLPGIRLLEAINDSTFTTVRDSATSDKSSWLIPELNPTLDTLSYWIKDTLLLKKDTLLFELSYLFTDTSNIDVIRRDTIELFNPKPQIKPGSKEEQRLKEEAEKAKKKADKERQKKEKGKKRKKNTEETATNDSLKSKTVFMKLSLKSKPKMDIGARPVIEASEPLDSLQTDMLHLECKIDSLWHPMKFRLEQDSLNLRIFTVHADPHYSPGVEYRIIADSAAMHNIYGNPIDSTCLTFSELKPDEYAHLLFNITGTKGPAFVELLSEKDTPVQKAKVENGQAKFVHVNAGKYYARFIEDTNENGIFDTGSLIDNRQPEEVFYLPLMLELRTNWNFQQVWDVRKQPLETQKPKEVIQNKEKQKVQKKSRNAEEYKDKIEKLNRLKKSRITSSDPIAK